MLLKFGAQKNLQNNMDHRRNKFRLLSQGTNDQAQTIIWTHYITEDPVPFRVHNVGKSETKKNSLVARWMDSIATTINVQPREQKGQVENSSKEKVYLHSC